MLRHGEGLSHAHAQKFPIGIASVGLGEIERQVPADEPPPLPVNARSA